MAKWILVDAMNLAYRCFHAVPHMSRSDGFPTNALHGWVRSLWRVQDQFKPEGMAVVFDSGEDLRRLKLLPEYKKQRSSMPESLARQLPCLEDVSRAMGFSVIQQDNVEADDLIGVLAESFVRLGKEVLILSADKDLAQCVGPGVSMLLPPMGGGKKGEWVILDEQGVSGKFGVHSVQVAELLALVGDSSDNIPGLPGVGPKTAAKWLSEFGDLENLLAHADMVQPVRFRELIIEREADLRRNLELTRLFTDIEVACPSAERCDPERLFGLLEEMQMKGALAEAKRRCAS